MIEDLMLIVYIHPEIYLTDAEIIYKHLEKGHHRLGNEYEYYFDPWIQII